MFSTKQKQDLERKHVVHFPRRTLNENENQIPISNNQMTTQPKLSMKVRTKSKPRSS
jgi:hypothetical protein